MKKPTILLLALLMPFSASAQTATQRPHITGIDHVAFYTTAPQQVRKLYAQVLGLQDGSPVESGELMRFLVGTQWVGYSQAPDSKATDRMDHVAFRTDDVTALSRYLSNKGFKPSQIHVQSDHSRSFRMQDPEGHPIEFVEQGKAETPSSAPGAVSSRMIHTGFLVYNRPAEDHFYLEVLGFRPYWHGGMKDGQTDWVSIQVPDGTDWLEYMLNQPPHPDLQLTGVMNHISFGVADMKRAQAIMESHGWKPHGDEQAEIGRDGKWQLDVFDPDLTRVEMMEFKPAQKPCCSDFTASHPAE